MKNPEEEEKKQNENATPENADKQKKENKDVNWDEHQQIDEEGNELDPEDVK